MDYKRQELKQGITVHNINTDKFKTNIVAIFLTTPMSREYVTFNSMISSVLRRGTKNMPTQEEISKELEEMYGANFNNGIDKLGDNHTLKFYMESINDEYLPQGNENLLKQSIQKLSEIVFNPILENNVFKQEYLDQEKQAMTQRINAKIDNKALYASHRCVECMYKDDPAALYKYGYVEDIDKINSENLYNHYKELIDNCKIDIFISGKNELEKSLEMLSEDENIKKLKPRKPDYIINDIMVKEEPKEQTVEEKQNVNQGKIVIGCDILFNNDDLKDENLRYEALLYNNLLGGSANSKLFQNVREKASLAYTASSNYVRFKSNIYIKAGIEIQNYEKAIKIIKEQLESMRNGEFTEEEIENEKKAIISGIDLIDDEQDAGIVYFYGQEISNNHVELEDYKQKIRNVTKDQILNIAKKIKINTIYFLRN